MTNVAISQISPMNIRPPHFLLFSGACRNRLGDNSSLSDGWRFVLESINGDDSFEVADAEPGVAGERLELLAVVRGLEALNQPSQVTLITASRYVNSGMHFGLDQWRDDDWRWERFGHRVSVNNADLWKRVDRALQYHSVECKYWRADPAPSPDAAAGERIMLRKEESGGRQMALLSLFWKLSIFAVQLATRSVGRIFDFGRDERCRPNYIPLVQSTA